MNIKITFPLIFAMVIAAGCQATGNAAGEEEVRIPDSYKISAISGVPTVVYGQRHRDCDSLKPPSFSWFKRNAITEMPSHGTLSDAGVGKRGSLKCGKVVPVRAVAYTSEPGFSGTDRLVVWSEERVIITVIPE